MRPAPGQSVETKHGPGLCLGTPEVFFFRHPMPVLFWIGIWTILYGVSHGFVPAPAVEAPRAVLPAVPLVPVSPAEAQMPARAKRRRDARGRFTK